MAALTIFHGPLVEGSFSDMSDMMCAKRNRMEVGTYAALQKVKCTLRAKRKSACQYFRPTKRNRRNRKFLSLCASIRTSASRRRRFLAKQKEARAVEIAELGLTGRNPGAVAAKKRQMKAMVP